MDEQIKELLDYFQEYLLDTEGTAAGLLGTAKATYPMIVVSLGKETGNGLGIELKYQLLKMWPPYKESLLFLQAEGSPEDLQFSILGSKQILTLEDVQEQISMLFEENNYFKNYTRLLVFYLLDTTACIGNVDLDAYLDMIKACSQVFAFPSQNSVFFLTLNERIGNEGQSSKIRCDYSNLYFNTGRAKEIVPCTYIVSNKNTIGSFMSRQNHYFDQIFADIILLCNGPDTYVSSNMLYGAVKTVGYTTQAKPVDDISKAAVSSLLKKISDLQDSKKTDEAHLLGENPQELLGRLGIQKDGTFYMLDSYINAASRYFPTQDEVDAFPRRTSEDLDLFSLSVTDVEKETFGAWGCYMESIVSKVEQEIISGLQQEESFQDTYLRHLQKKFSRGELIWMSKNQEEIREVLNQEYYSYGTRNVIDSLKEELALRVFQNAGIKEAIIDTIVKAGEQAREFMRMWNELVNTESIIVRQIDIIPFYDQKVQQYIDRNAERITRAFQTISDVDGLKDFLFGEIRILIKSDPVFRAPFEEELIQRVNQKDPAQALRAIAEQLCGTNVKIWLASNGASLDDPVQMSLLMQDETALYESLHEILPDQKYYYYDTDINESADALNIYVLNETQLMI